MLPRHARYCYSYPDDRPGYNWPADRRLAFYVATNLECFAFRAGYTEGGQGAPTHRDYARHEYGLRAGVAYLLDVFDELGLRAAHNVNSALYVEHGALLDRVRRRGDEIIAHGRTNSERQDGLWEVEEARLIAQVTDTIARHEGKRPAGWMGPWRAESNLTPDLLQEAGYRYLMDWPCDDQPLWMKTRAGRILCIPYSLEVNDGTAIARNAHSASEFADILVDQFEEMLRQSAKRPLVMGVGLHPFVTGQPFRVRRLREALRHCVNHPSSAQVWYTVPGDVAAYCYGLPEGLVTA